MKRVELRAQGWVHDARISAGQHLPLPKNPVPGAMRLLYIFSGKMDIGGIEITTGESAILDDELLVAYAKSDTDALLFTTDPDAPIFKDGMFSGNILTS